MKRLLSGAKLLFVCVFLLVAMGVSAHAAKSGYYTYSVSDGKATITDVSADISGDIEIPSTLGGYPVTSIGSWAFVDCSSLTSITIPDGITWVGKYAFMGCTNLKSITIPDSVTSIGDWAFVDCSSLTRITIPDSVTSIGDYAFVDCSSLTSITIPDGVTSIGFYAFDGCSSLTSITIPDSVTSIEDYAFDGCPNVTIYGIEGSVAHQYATSNSIPFEAIAPDLSEYYTYSVSDGKATIEDVSTDISGDIEIPSTLGGYPVTSIGVQAFMDCTSLTSITIPDGVTAIGKSAFENCTGLTSITIPDIVTDIGEYAFWGCRSLTSITIPGSVTSIGEGAFYNCSSLTSVTLQDGVSSIGFGVFGWCTSLTSITIPESVIDIGFRAFEACPNLTIYGAEWSFAQWYANENSIPFQVITPAPAEDELAVAAEVIDGNIVLTITSDISTTSKFMPVALYDQYDSVLEVILVPTTTDDSDLPPSFKDRSDASYVKVFLWNSCEDLSPVTNSAKAIIERP